MKCKIQAYILPFFKNEDESFDRTWVIFWLTRPSSFQITMFDEQLKLVFYVRWRFLQIRFLDDYCWLLIFDDQNNFNDAELED